MKREEEDDLGPISEWMRSDRPPFGEEDYAAMRRGVWRQIEARPGGEGAFRPGRLLLAGGALLAAALIAVLRLRPASQVQVVTPPVPDRVHETSAEVSSGRGHVDDDRPPLSATSPSSSASRLRSRTASRPGAAPTGEAPVKIEFQTANPNVRIIWLVKKGEAVPHPNSSSRKEETS